MVEMIQGIVQGDSGPAIITCIFAFGGAAIIYAYCRRSRMRAGILIREVNDSPL